MQNFITNNNCRATSSELLIIFQLLSETKKLAYVIMHKGFAPLCDGGYGSLKHFFRLFTLFFLQIILSMESTKLIGRVI